MYPKDTGLMFDMLSFLAYGFPIIHVLPKRKTSYGNHFCGDSILLSAPTPHAKPDFRIECCNFRNTVCHRSGLPGPNLQLSASHHIARNSLSKHTGLQFSIVVQRKRRLQPSLLYHFYDLYSHRNYLLHRRVHMFFMRWKQALLAHDQVLVSIWKSQIWITCAMGGFFLSDVHQFFPVCTAQSETNLQLTHQPKQFPCPQTTLIDA